MASPVMLKCIREWRLKNPERHAHQNRVANKKYHDRKRLYDWGRVAKEFRRIGI
jgi:hypothetical protein